MLIFHSYVSLPEGKPPFSIIFLWFSYGFPMVFHSHVEYYSPHPFFPPKPTNLACFKGEAHIDATLHTLAWQGTERLT